MPIGMIQVGSHIIKNEMLPAPRRCLADLTALLPVIATNKCQELVKIMKADNDKVAYVPSTVEQFVTFMASIKEVADGEDDRADKFAFITDFYKMLAAEKIKVPDEDRDLLEKLQANKNALSTSRDLAESSIGDNTMKFTKELEVEVPRLKKRIKANEEKLKNDALNNPASDLEAMLALLDGIANDLKDIELNAKKSQGYQEILALDREPFEELQNFKLDFDVKNSLWRSLSEWDAITLKWLTDTFDAILVDDISAATTKYMKVVSKGARKLGSENGVVVVRFFLMKFAFFLFFSFFFFFFCCYCAVSPVLTCFFFCFSISAFGKRWRNSP